MRAGEPRRLPQGRVDVQHETVERSLVALVLAVVELLRQLMERQALRRVDQGDLTDQQIEEIGRTLMALEERMAELRRHFGLSIADLNMDLGPLGPLLSIDGDDEPLIAHPG
ncbi:MAG: gas vesicle protein K [Actinobacteria bacterium]|nr:gas vesicle protein K [Candidatus Dormibacteraeota bacterium]MBO0838124.1 gas vesicle protein K [Actinomycetota bacterium]